MALRTVSSDRLVDGAKLGAIVTSGDGSLFLDNSGEYSAPPVTSGVDSVNGQTGVVIIDTGTVTNVTSANSDIAIVNGTTTPELTLNSGTGANQIVKLDGTAKLPAVDGSQLTNLPVQTNAGYYTYILSAVNSDISGYESMPSLPSYTMGALATIGVASGTTRTLMASFATNIGFPNVSILPAGVINLHYETIKSSGGMGYYTYFELYVRTSGGVETLIATSDASSTSTSNANVATFVSAITTSNLTLALSDRIVVKIYCVLTSGSTTVTLRYDDATNARLELTSSLVDATNFVPYNGATANVDLGARSIVASNLSGTNTGDKTFPQGFLVNGKIVPSVSSNNLTVALKTLSGGDPSTSDPIFCRIGDTVRTITSALSASANAGTGWFGASGTLLAGLEVDYFVYLAYSTGLSSVVLGFSRMPYYVNFSGNGFGTGDGRFLQTVGGVSGVTYAELVGRFAATLSAGNLWTVPTYTSDNLVNKPVNETRWLTCAPAIVVNGTTPSGTEINRMRYQISMNTTSLSFHREWATAGVGNSTVTATIPVSEKSTFLTDGLYGGLNVGGGSGYGVSNSSTVQLRGGTTRTNGNSINANIFVLAGFYEI